MNESTFETEFDSNTCGPILVNICFPVLTIYFLAAHWLAEFSDTMVRNVVK